MVSSQIEEFFANQTVLITGGSGFLGKILIEKLLRTCPSLLRIYVLMRPKKNKTPEERFQELFDYPCFDLLKAQSTDYRSKVRLVEGDCTKPRLALSESDIRTLTDEVTCVIHAAANVKFDQTLREGAANARATLDLLWLAKQMENLTAFVYVSTAFSNCIRDVTKEEFYAPPITAEKLFGIVDGLDDKMLEELTPKLLGEWPNTYVYAKCITEDVIRTHGEDLPIAVVRPAIITSSADEPMPGWIDNFYGLVGITIGVALGVIKSIRAKLDNPAYVVPVDYVSNLILAAAWKASTGEKRIYNFVGHKNNIVDWRTMFNVIEPHCWDAASEKVVWYYSMRIRENKVWHEICLFFLHTVQAYFVDFFLWCVGRKALAVKNYRRLNKLLRLLEYFSMKKFCFEYDNVMKLWEEMADEDRKRFNFNMEKMSWNKLARDSVFGGRLYLLKDTIDTIPKGKRKLKILFFVHYAVVGLFWFLVFKFVMFLLKCLFGVAW